jgi:hypothetical protein
MSGTSPLRKKSGNYGRNYPCTLDAADLFGNFFLSVGKARDTLHSRLGSLQQKFLQAFFSKEKRFFLTGGAALAGFHLGHRETHDIDLFTLMDVMDEGSVAVAETAREMNARLESIQTSPDFRRYILTMESEAIVIDLIRERVAQIVADKPVIGIIAVDPPEEILANKLCALLGRAEIRDLVDIRALEIAGYPVESALPAAASKDGGLTPGQLSWVLSQIALGDDLIPPGGIPVDELRKYLNDLIVRLSKLAFPKKPEKESTNS